MTSLHRVAVAAALVGIAAAALAGCYTKVRTGPREPPPTWALPPESVPHFDQPSADSVAASIDGDYSGYLLIVDTAGHHMSKIQFSFHEKEYRYAADDGIAGAGDFALDRDEVVLQDNGGQRAGADSLVSLQGRFELKRNRDGIQLVLRGMPPDRYLELGLRREAAPAPSAAADPKM